MDVLRNYKRNILVISKIARSTRHAPKLGVRRQGVEKGFGKLIVLAIFGTVSMTAFFAGAQSVSLDPAKMRRIGTIDERFQSYNVEMLEAL
jgi:hypothetical protein